MDLNVINMVYFQKKDTLNKNNWDAHFFISNITKEHFNKTGHLVGMRFDKNDLRERLGKIFIYRGQHMRYIYKGEIKSFVSRVVDVWEDHINKNNGTVKTIRNVTTQW